MSNVTISRLDGFETVASGLRFPEGPIAMRDGSVLVVEIRRGTLSRVPPNGKVEVVAELGGGPNGAAIGPDGAVYVCNNGGFEFHDFGTLAVPGHAPKGYDGGSVQRVDPKTGKVTTLYRDCDGRGLRGPNDIVFDETGGFWFTDYGKHDDLKLDRGFLYYARPDGSAITCARSNLTGPNGVGLSPNGKVLYVAETLTSRLWAFDIAVPGQLKAPEVPWMPGRLVGVVPWMQMLDSLAVQRDGKVCVAGGPRGGVTIFNPEREEIEHRELHPPEIIVTNMCFGGADMRDVWITESGTGRLLKTRWDEAGLPLAFGG